MLSEEGRDFEVGQVNMGFYRKNRFEKLALSLFAQSRNSLQEPPVLKVPFHVSAGEALAFTTWDTRFAGWGPLFSGALVISLVMMVFLWREKRDAFRIGAVVITWLLVSVLIFPEPWWARFVPQVWFLPVVALVLAWPVQGRQMVFLRKVLAATMVAEHCFCFFCLSGCRDMEQPLSSRASCHPLRNEHERAAVRNVSVVSIQW